MEITIRNCNNIESGSVLVAEGRINIKYAINGTGKSSIAKAVEAFSLQDEARIKMLTPLKYLNDGDKNYKPFVTGLQENLKVAIFDESYVSQYVFQNDDLLKNSFEVFIKTANYDSLMVEINQSVVDIRNTFSNNPDLDRFISDMGEFLNAFGRTSNGMAKNSPFAKGMGAGNLIENIPNGLEDYRDFLTSDSNSKWLRWQKVGHDEYMGMGTRCPFCGENIEQHRDKIERVYTEYDAKTIEHLTNILGLVERFENYFTKETLENVHEITMSVHGLSEEQINYLVEVKNEVQTIYNKLHNIRELSFFSLKSSERIADILSEYQINLQLITHLNSNFTQEKVRLINGTLEDLRRNVGRIQGAVNRQKIEIAKTIEKYSQKIDDFLAAAGFKYVVSMDETAEQTYKMHLRLRFEGKDEEKGDVVSGVKEHLSFGERNAFALVLFMYNALYNQADFIILDDPISSFDKNKKFAILDKLFMHGDSFRGKTVLFLTHDFEPVIDMLCNYSHFLQNTPNVYFLENKHGLLSEKEIGKDDIISSVGVALDNVRKAQNDISKIIFLRRYFEIVEGKNDAWSLLSNLIHKREIPTVGNGSNNVSKEMNGEQITRANESISKYFSDFSYDKVLKKVKNRKYLISLYDSSTSNYEKLQIYRILFDVKEEENVMRKFINQVYHIENDFLFQLNPLRYNEIPDYVVEHCDSEIDSIRDESND